MIYTGNYTNCKSSNVVSISGDRGKSIGFVGEYYKPLAPKLSFWTEWHNNIGKISEEENNAFYMIRYYETVLKYLDIEEIKRVLDGKILACYEEPEKFCHRHMFAACLKLEYGILVPEAIVTDNGIVEIPRNNQIEEDYKRLILTRVGGI